MVSAKLQKVMLSALMAVVLASPIDSFGYDGKQPPPPDDPPPPPPCCPNAVPVYTLTDPKGGLSTTIGLPVPVSLHSNRCIQFIPNAPNNRMIYEIIATGGADHDVCLDDQGRYLGWFPINTTFFWDGDTPGRVDPDWDRRYIARFRAPENNCQIFTLTVIASDQEDPCNAGEEITDDTIEIAVWAPYIKVYRVSRDHTFRVWGSANYHVTVWHVSKLEILNDEMRQIDQVVTVSMKSTVQNPAITDVGRTRLNIPSLSGPEVESRRKITNNWLVPDTYVSDNSAMMVLQQEGAGLSSNPSRSYRANSDVYYTREMIAECSNQIENVFTYQLHVGGMSIVRPRFWRSNFIDQKLPTPHPNPGGCCS